MIVTFRWTTEALLAGAKTETRRDWSPIHARKFRPDTLIQAYDKSPRQHGRQVAVLMVKSLTRERTGMMTEASWESEGFRYLWETHQLPDASPSAFEAWRRADIALWVLRFEVIESKPLSDWMRTDRVATPMQLPGVSA